MKLLLISPASGAWKGIGRNTIFNGKTFRFSLLSLLTVAAETPHGVEVKIVDDQFEGTLTRPVISAIYFSFESSVIRTG